MEMERLHLPRQNDTSVTRAAILRQAQHLTEKGGVDALSVSKVAKALGMSHSNVYRHFASKEALMAEIATVWMADMQAACEAAILRGTTTRERLSALVRAIRAELFKRAEDLGALAIFRFVLDHRPDAAIAHHTHRRKLVVQVLKSAGWSDGPEADEAALTILDAFRFFTDPHAISAYKDMDFGDNVERMAAFLADWIDQTAHEPR